MSIITGTKTNFTSGELDKSLYGRGDLSAYENGAGKLKNVVVYPTGGVARRAGLEHIDTLTGKGRLIAFQFNTEQVYILVFLDKKVSVYQNNIKLCEFISPWQESQLAQIHWTQSADTLLVAHPDVPLYEITRTTGGNWLCEAMSFYENEEDNRIMQPYYKFAKDEVTLTPSAVTGAISLTSSAALFEASDIGSRYRFGTDGEVEITAVNSSVSADATVIKDLSTSSAIKDWQEQAFSLKRGWPVSVTYHQDRLVIGGSRSLPNRLWLSKSSDLKNFDLGTGLDDEAIEFPILSDQVNAIRAVFSGRHLQVFTSGAEWMVTGSPLTPVNIQLNRQTRVGMATNCYVPPRVVDGATLFAGANGHEIREFLFADVEQAYLSTDLAVLSKHLVNNPIDQDYDPNRRLFYVVMSDGSIAVMTNYRAEKVTAWSKFETKGLFSSIAVAGDDVYVLVQRDDDFYLECFNDDFGTDGGLCGQSEVLKNIWSGLDHLNGQYVMVKAGGASLGRFLVENGSITLPYEVTHIEAGLSYSHEIQPLPPMIGTAGGARPPKAVRLIEVSFRIFETASLFVNTGRGSKSVPLKNMGEGLLDKAPELFSGDVSIRAIGWNKDQKKPLWKVEGEDPLPCVILSVTTSVKVGG